MIPNDKLITNSFQRERGDDEVSQCSNRSSIVHVEYETLPYDISPSHSKEINDKTANKNIYEQGKFYFFKAPKKSQINFAFF